MTRYAGAARVAHTMNNTNYSPAELAKLALGELRVAVRLSWFQPDVIIERLDLWHSTLAAAFLAAFEGDEHRGVDLPNSAGRGSADDVLHGFNDWLGRDVVFSILEDYRELLEVSA